MNKSPKSVARLQSTYAVRAGIIVNPGACEKCGLSHTRLHKHHPDYNKPLDVIWLCPSCHTKEHPIPNPFKGKPMHKKYFWAIQERPVFIVNRFRTEAARGIWVASRKFSYSCAGDHPEVRRIKNRLIQGEKLTWPVEIEN